MRDKFFIPKFFDDRHQSLLENFIQRFPELKGQEASILLIHGKSAKKASFVREEEEVYCRILEDPKYYSYVEKLMNGEIPVINVGFVYPYAPMRHVEISKVSIIENIEKLKKEGKINLTREAEEHLQKLCASASFASYINDASDKIYRLKIDGTKYEVPIPVLLSFIFLDSDAFYAAFKKETINNIASAHFAYIVVHFLKYVILNNYIVPEVIKNRYQEIIGLQLIDIQALNQPYDNGEPIVSQIEINPDLKLAILKDMPNNLSLLEQSIFIYIRMCDLLDYDDEYYVFGQIEAFAKKHTDLKHIKEISPTNNLVVCYEFTAIYAFLLRELNIPLEIRYEDDGNNYGKGHALLEYRVAKYMVIADAFTGIINGDAFRVKVADSLHGLECINENLETQKEFLELVQRVYELFIKLKLSAENHAYYEVLPAMKDRPFAEKMQFLCSQINDTPYGGMTPFSYLIYLKHALFKSNEIKITVVKNNITSNDSKRAMATAIITINENGIREDSSHNSYFVYDEESYLRPISMAELRHRFQERVYQYVTRNDPLIPGLNYNGRSV